MWVFSPRIVSRGCDDIRPESKNHRALPPAGRDRTVPSLWASYEKVIVRVSRPQVRRCTEKLLEGQKKQAGTKAAKGPENSK